MRRPDTPDTLDNLATLQTKLRHLKKDPVHNCMAAADSAVVLLELVVQWDFAQTH